MTSLEPERLPVLEIDAWDRENEMLARFKRVYDKPVQRRALYRLLCELEAPRKGSNPAADPSEGGPDG